MDPFHFACPHCSSRLRLREKLYVGRQVDCPECGQVLLIVDDKGELAARPIERKVPATAAAVANKNAARQSGTQSEKPKAGGAAAPNAEPAVSAPASDSLTALSGRRIKVLTAGAILLAVGLITAAFVFRPSGLPNDTGSPQAGIVQPGVPDKKDAAAGPAGDKDAAPKEPPRDDAELRLTKIGQLLLDRVKADETFPSGTVPIRGIAPESRLSWMAVLADRIGDGAVHPLWDKPWNSPPNEAFVRRRLVMFQNPAIAELTGADGYPASHFVGVTGVGADSARLDNRHPRAGIFGEDRQTRIEDIRDGASNTLLLLGVRDQLGSWAAGGQPTMRGLVREPYVNGPDGFGTGSPDSMHALLADGRVVVLSNKIAPRILRRMAAKADGLALDESEAGEPGDRPSLLAGDAATEEPNEDGTAITESPHDKRPLEPEFAPEPAQPAVKKINLDVSLKQPIARFDQPKSKPLSDVLTGVAEMAGTQIDIDRENLGPAASRLSEPVALKLDNTTVGDILTGLLRPAGLAYRVEGDHLKVVVRGEE